MIDVELILHADNTDWTRTFIKNVRINRPYVREYVRDTDDIEYRIQRITTFVACDILRVELVQPPSMIQDSLDEWLKRGWREE